MTPLQAIGWRWTDASLDPAWAGLMAAHPQARQARISEQHRSGYLVAETVDAAHRAESLPEWQRAGSYRKGEITPESRPAVGDWVLIEGEAPNALRIVALLPRFSSIKRGAAGEHYKQQVIAANIDTVFVVCGLDADFNPRRIERYLLLVGASGVQPVIVLTKSDKDSADVEAAMEELRASTEGSDTKKVEPAPARLSTQIRPFCRSSTRCAMVRPNPSPFAVSGLSR